jgi:hypothetical protein
MTTPRDDYHYWKPLFDLVEVYDPAWRSKSWRHLNCLIARIGRTHGQNHRVFDRVDRTLRQRRNGR